MSNSLCPHELQHASLPCPSPTLGVYSNSCPLSQCCHLTISSSVFPFFSTLQSFPEPGSFQMSQFFASGGQSIGVSASVSVLPMNIQGWIFTHIIRLNLLIIWNVSYTLKDKHQFYFLISCLLRIISRQTVLPQIFINCFPVRGSMVCTYFPAVLETRI